jgi:hypothetical protein
MVLQNMIHRLNESVRCYGMENNEEKTKLMRISRQPPPVQNERSKTTKECKVLQKLGYHENK